MGVQVNSYFKSKYTGAQIENMLDAFGNTAAAYETSTAYSVGDLVLYNNALYVCTGATTGTFDPSKWQQTTLAELVENLGATYTDPNNDGNVVVGVDSTTGNEILRSITFPTLPKKYYLPFAQYIRTDAANDPASASFDVEIPDAEEAPMHSTVIKGKTVAVNQLSHDVADSSGSQSDVSYVWTSNKITLNGTATSNFTHSIGGGWQYDDIPVGHTVLLVPCITGSNGYPTTEFAFRASDNTIFLDVNIVYPTITTLSDSANRHVENIRAVSGTSFSNYTTTHPMVIDLNTSPVASRLTEIGTDVAKLKQVWLEEKGEPLPLFIPYNTGFLKNTDGEYRVRGRNLWDGQIETGSYDTSTGAKTGNSSSNRNVNPVKVLPNTQYYTNKGLFLYFYDANMNFVYYNNQGANLFTTPENAVYMNFRQSKTDWDGTNTIFNLSDSSINGQYFPYYNGGTIDCSAAPLNGFDTASDEVDYANGKRTQRTETDNLGDLTWTKVTVSGEIAFRANLYNRKLYSASQSSYNLIVSNYAFGIAHSGQTNLVYNMPDKTWGICYDGSNYIYIKDSTYSSGDETAFKTAMGTANAKVCFELATYTTTTETPQPVYTQYGFNVFEPVSGGVQSAEVNLTYYENIAGYIDKKIGA